MTQSWPNFIPEPAFDWKGHLSRAPISGHKLADLPGWCSFYDDSPLRRLDSFDSFDQADACSLKWPTPEKPLKVWPCLLASFEVTLYTGSPVCCAWVVPAMNHLWPDHSPGFFGHDPKKRENLQSCSSNWNFQQKKQQQKEKKHQVTCTSLTNWSLNWHKNPHTVRSCSCTLVLFPP